MAHWLDDDDTLVAGVLADFAAAPGGALVRFPGDAWDPPALLQPDHPDYPAAWVDFGIDTERVDRPFGAGEPDPSRQFLVGLTIYVQTGAGAARGREIRRLLAYAFEAATLPGRKFGAPRSFAAPRLDNFDAWGLAISVDIDGV